MFKSFLNDSRLETWTNEIETFAVLTGNFTPKDLKHVAAKIQLKFNLGKENFKTFEYRLKLSNSERPSCWKR